MIKKPNIHNIFNLIRGYYKKINKKSSIMVSESTLSVHKLSPNLQEIGSRTERLRVG